MHSGGDSQAMLLQGDKSKGMKAWVLIAPALFAGFLGCWQVNRYHWKVKVIREQQKAFQAEPYNILDSPETPEQFTRVAAEGTYAHDKSVYIGPRPRSSMGTATPGYTLVTPLMANEWGKGALVMRGWVPATWRSQPGLRESHQPAGKVHVEGVVRTNDNPSMFVPANDPSSDQFFWIDVPALAKACDMPEGTPLIEVMEKGERPVIGRGNIPTQMDVLAMRTQRRTAASTSPAEASPMTKPAEPLPIPRNEGDLLKPSVTPADHRNYALTWFTLSGATSFMALRILRPK